MESVRTEGVTLGFKFQPTRYQQLQTVERQTRNGFRFLEIYFIHPVRRR